MTDLKNGKKINHTTMENNHLSPNGCRITYREQWDENSITDYFSQNIKIKKNGEDYNPEYYNESNTNIPYTPSNVGDVEQVDPNEFFGKSSLGDLFKNI